MFSVLAIFCVNFAMFSKSFHVSIIYIITCKIEYGMLAKYKLLSVCRIHSLHSFHFHIMFNSYTHLANIMCTNTLLHLKESRFLSKENPGNQSFGFLP